MIDLFYYPIDTDLNITAWLKEVEKTGICSDIDYIKYRNTTVLFTKVMGIFFLRQYAIAQYSLDASKLQFTYSPQGKPSFIHYPHIHFNISHSGAYIVWALSDTPIGIDIEEERAAKMNVARRFFHPNESSELEQCSELLRNHLFYQIWTAKESYVKYTGWGISEQFNLFFVKIKGEDAKLFNNEHEQLPPSIHLFDTFPGYQCALCSSQLNHLSGKPVNIISLADKIGILLPTKNEHSE